MGKACAEYYDKHVRGLICKRIQVDEVWGFCHCKQKDVPHERKGQFGIGDVWTWTAVDADPKLIVSYLVGGRSAEWAKEFMDDVADRIINRIQLTSDGHRAYLQAVENAFGGDVDYAQLIKVYGAEVAGPARYSPPQVIGVELSTISGAPHTQHVSTSFVERQNLIMRMSMRRFTRLTNGFSKKIENMMHAVALNFMYYDFCRIHHTLRVTPAMEAGLRDHVWELKELVTLLG
jgi:IS1 family transposase